MEKYGYIGAEGRKHRILRMGPALPEGVLSEITRELGTMLAAGVPLSKALLVFSDKEQAKPAVRKAFRKVYSLVCQGMSLWQAMEEQSPAFPPVMIQCVRAAEQSGCLGQTLLELSEDYRREHELKSQMRAALLYPKILMVLLAGMLWLMVYIILPQFAPLFSYMEELPWPTKILYCLTDGIRRCGPMLIAAVFAAVILERTAGRMGWIGLQRDRIRLKIPILGPLRKMICTARFARVLCSLYEAGIPLPEALRIAGGAAGNAWLERKAQETAYLVEQGFRLSDALEQETVFLKKLIFIVQAGEESGQLSPMLRSASQSMEYDGRQALRRLASYLEPGMILVMAVLIGFVMAAVLMPVYASYEGIGQMIY